MAVQAELSDTVSSNSDTSEVVGECDVNTLIDSGLVDMCRRIIATVDANKVEAITDDPYM